MRYIGYSQDQYNFKTTQANDGYFKMFIGTNIKEKEHDIYINRNKITTLK